MLYSNSGTLNKKTKCSGNWILPIAGAFWLLGQLPKLGLCLPQNLIPIITQYQLSSCQPLAC